MPPENEPVVKPKRRKIDHAKASAMTAEKAVRFVGTWLMLISFAVCVASKMAGPIPGVPPAVAACCSLVNTTGGVPALPGVAP